jgi:hypothetical protein
VSRDARGGGVLSAVIVAIPLAVLGVWLYGQIDPAAPPAATGSRGD